MHSDAGQHHNHVVVVVVILFSGAGDALWCGSECFGCERLFPNLLLRCSWIRRRHQVVPINQYGIFNKFAKLNFQNVDIAWSVYKYQRQKRKNCRYTDPRSVLKKLQTTLFSSLLAFGFIFPVYLPFQPTVGLRRANWKLFRWQTSIKYLVSDHITHYHL